MNKASLVSPVRENDRLEASKLEATVTTLLNQAIHRLRSHTFVGPSLQTAPLPPTPHPDDYIDPRRFAEDYQIASMLKKVTTGATGDATAAEARRKFFAAESHNRLTNRRLIDELDHPSWVEHVSRELIRILGPLDAPVLNGMVENGGFGPGSCVGITERDAVLSTKYDSRPVMTAELVPYFAAIAGEFVTSYWAADSVRVVRGNHHFTVPKNAETDRNAAKEPIWNSFIQKGIGRRIEARLMHFGVDIQDQSRNQFLASVAQARGLATIDLSQASDMISHGCVWLLLNHTETLQGLKWWHLLQLARSKSMRILGEGGQMVWHDLEMFSSMGNGFTFPLETAIFLAVLRTVVPRGELDQIAAYGDDLICPQVYAGQVIERLEYLGFQVNHSKSCLAGRFFESCGTDWFDGQNVRPFFLRWNPEAPIPYGLQIANALRCWLMQTYGCCPSEFRELWDYLRAPIPKGWKCPVPVVLGDVGLVVSEKEARVMQALKRPKGWLEDSQVGWDVRHALIAPVERDKRSFGVLASALHSAGRTTLVNHDRSLWNRKEPWDTLATNGREAVRNQYGQVRTRTTRVLFWDSVSDWV